MSSHQVCRVQHFLQEILWYVDGVRDGKAGSDFEESKEWS